MPSLIPAPGRLRRLLGLSPVVAALAACAVAAPASAANTPYSFFLDVTPTNSYAEAWTDTFDSSATYTIDVIRGDAVIASGSGSFSDQGVDYPGVLLAGDVVRFSGGGATRSVTFDGTPTVDSGACAGSRTVSGAVSSAASALYVGSSIGSGSAGTIRATPARSGGSYTAAFDGPLTSGATVYASQELSVNGGDTTLYTTREAPVVASCPRAATPSESTTILISPPVAKPNVAAQVLQSLQAVLGQQGTLLAATDSAKIARTGYVTIPFAFVTPGTVTFAWKVTLLGGKPAGAAAKKKAKKKVVTIGTGTAKAASAGKGKVRLKLTATGRRLLKSAKAVQVTMSARFVPSDGTAAQQTTTKFTLRHKAKAKKKTKR